VTRKRPVIVTEVSAVPCRKVQGDLDAARSAVAESMKLRPEINSVASWRAENLFYTNPRFTALAEKTLYAGLRRAGFLDE
jgi:hypothetical protein